MKSLLIPGDFADLTYSNSDYERLDYFSERKYTKPYSTSFL